MGKFTFFLLVTLFSIGCMDVETLSERREASEKAKERAKKLQKEFDRKKEQEKIVIEDIFLGYSFNMDKESYTRHTQKLLDEGILKGRDSTITHILETDVREYECSGFFTFFGEHTKKLSSLDFTVRPIDESITQDQVDQDLKLLISQRYNVDFLDTTECGGLLFFGQNLSLSLSCVDETGIKVHYADLRTFKEEQNIEDSIKLQKRRKAIKTF